ncbi:CUB-like protein [Maribacter caenipelagi]|uniref:CUB-like protein n=1 Tax=Maribacter caenipelagi TaxID=1447781 RepID=A0A4R7CTD1_9FLAO|nr:Calx-beta domain-containing protein [Maribacter caenipelagi]TDS11659.1 CUB-like protein [Maribacter caenipelagi]
MSFKQFYYLLFLLGATSFYAQETYRDNFSSVSYSNNNGSSSFSTNWVETGDTDLGPNSQYLRISSSRLEFYYIWSETIRRSANLTGSVSATLSFNWQSLNLSGTTALDVQVSSNGGASYTSVGTVTGNTTGTFNQDITPYISANTTVRFAKTNANWNNNQYAFIDNFQIATTQPPPSPVMQVNDVSVNEDVGNMTFTVTHTGLNASGPFTVNYQTLDGLATAGSDYTANSGSLSFNGNTGQSSLVTIPILDDGTIESTETFTLQLISTSNPSVVISDIGTASIIDDDSISMTNSTTSNECGKVFLDPGGLGNYGNNLNVTHTLCPEPGKDYVVVDFTSFDIDSGGDFLYVYDGNSTSSPLIGQYDNDNIPSTIASTGGTGCLTFRFTSNNNGTGTGFEADIVCYTEGPRLVIDDVSIDEDGGNIVFTVSSTRAAHGRNFFLIGFQNTPFTVDYITTNGSALAGSDYTSTSGTLTFTGAIGNQRTISVPITNDGVPEFDEDFFIEFTGVNAPDAQVNFDDTGKGTINSQILSNVPLTLFKQFEGDYDYVSTGGSLRTAGNATNPCAIQATSTNQLVSDIPATGTIKAAYLYWAHSSYVRDEQVTFEGQTVNAGSVYQTTFNANNNNLSFFGYISDVTSLVSGITDINNNDFDFSGLTIDTSNNFCGSATVLGGWSLFIYYEDPLLPAVSINLYQGFDGLQNNSPGTPFTLDSFFAIAGSGAKSTFLSWEGDDTLGSSGANPERLTITNQTGTPYTLTGDGGQTGNNAYNGTIFDNTTTPTIYNQTNTYGLDLDTYDLSTYIDPGDSEVTATVNVGQDYVINMAVVIKVPSNLITGTVFEDINYPGGLGRNQASSSGIGVSDVIVELFESSGTFIDRKTTNVDGQYTFAGMEDGDYLVKVVNSSVRSNRGGGLNCTTCTPVQTHRTYGDADAVTEVNTEIGGAFPNAIQDAALGILSNAQTVSSATVDSNGVTNINFGFNFNTIVNTNENGQGSLEQFIVNSNNLEETVLDIQANSIFDPAPEEDTSIFMIPPTGDVLGRTADVNYASGIFDILISNANPLSVITGTNTIIDGRTQTSYSGDSNTGTVGSGGTVVGTSGIALPDYNRPEIQIHKNNGDVLRLFGDGVTIRNASIYANNNAGIIVSGGSASILNTLLGVNASGSSAGNINFGVEITDGTTIVDSNYISTNTDAGVFVDGGISTLIQNNHFDANGATACDDNILLADGTGIVISQNLINNSAALGIDGEGIAGNILISENTITNSGQNGGICLGNVENAGIRLHGNNSSITNNIISNSGGSGIVLSGGTSSGNLVSQNSIFANGTANPALGIDLDASDAIGDGVTLNDSGDSDSGPNGLLNFPIISGAFMSGGNLVVEGWSRPGAIIELFLTDINQGTATEGDNQLGLSTDYGEGQVYIGTVTEGSTADLFSMVTPYTDLDNNTDNTNKFKFSIPMSIPINVGNYITSTATLSNSTSEFSPISIVENYTVITNRRITYRIKRN